MASSASTMGPALRPRQLLVDIAEHALSSDGGLRRSVGWAPSDSCPRRTCCRVVVKDISRNSHRTSRSAVELTRLASQRKDSPSRSCASMKMISEVVSASRDRLS